MWQPLSRGNNDIVAAPLQSAGDVVHNRDVVHSHVIGRARKAVDGAVEQQLAAPTARQPCCG